MKNKIAIVLIVLVVAAALTGVYFLKQNNSQVNDQENNAQENGDQSQEAVAENQGENDNGLTITKINPQTKIITDDFSIDLPEGWHEIDPLVGSIAMAVNMTESLDDPAAQKIGFKSYFAVNYDVFEGKSMSEYIQIIKNQLQGMFPDIVFTKNQDMEIGGNLAYAMEAEFLQAEADFKILMVIVAGQGDDSWILSFNTVKSAWDMHEETFYNVANNFVVKK